MELKSKTNLHLFFQVPSEKTCVTISMQRQGAVVGSQPAVVKLYDYYQPGKT